MVIPLLYPPKWASKLKFDNVHLVGALDWLFCLGFSVPLHLLTAPSIRFVGQFFHFFEYVASECSFSKTLGCTSGRFRNFYHIEPVLPLILIFNSRDYNISWKQTFLFVRLVLHGKQIIHGVVRDFSLWLGNTYRFYVCLPIPVSRRDWSAVIKKIFFPDFI